MPIHLLILNYNGRDLLGECLPSILRAAEVSRHDCEVAVVDNGSTDGSLDFLAAEHPQVRVYRCPNRGLCSFNDVLAELPGRVAVLLNNDIKFDERALDPLVAPLLAPSVGRQACFMTAPLCWRFDGKTYEGFRTAVGWRWGLVQATALFPGYERALHRASLTASAGAALAVDRRLFLALGGFDALYLPGRIEDLDFCFRGYQLGYQARYVPTAIAYHRGQTTFDRELGHDASRFLALRNTLLFQWKNLRSPRHLLRQAVGLPIRLANDLLCGAFRPRGSRFLFTRALASALWRVRASGVSTAPTPAAKAIQPWQQRVREVNYFQQFHPRAMALTGQDEQAARAWQAAERERGVRYPISQNYIRPAAGWLAQRLAATRVRPWHLTLCGLAAALAAASVLWAVPGASIVAAALVLVAWFFDRADGQLARRQGRTSPQGAWLDANIDELVDLGLHVAVAAAAARETGSHLAWVCLVGFLLGKYLLMYGLAVDEPPPSDDNDTIAADHPRTVRQWLRYVWHLPANADVRVHFLALGLASGWLTAELAAVACYYNIRWVARYVLVARRPAAQPLSSPRAEGAAS